MSTAALTPDLRSPVTPGAAPFAVAAVALMITAAILAGAMPVGFSIATVFLFAGPHNWMEARYFLTRLPGRWGKLRGYFLLGLGGVAALTLSYVALFVAARADDWGGEAWALGYATWATALVAWATLLIHLRSRQNPRRDWSWTVPAACFLTAIIWLVPFHFGLLLVYGHPLLALGMLDRELARSRPAWRPAYHRCLALLPLVLAALWWQLAGTPDLPGDDALTGRIARHAGAGLLEGVSSHLLVATHTFLEMLHYGVWLVAIPVAGLRAAPWRLEAVPLARRSPAWRRGLGLALAAGAGVVLLLWVAFLADYPVTRDAYFTVALVHVLAEVPFLLRAL